MDNLVQRTYFLKIDATNKKIRNALQKRFDMEGIDLTVDQWLVLNHAFQNEGISQIELCDLVYKDAATLTRIIDLLAKKQLEYMSPAKDVKMFSSNLIKMAKLSEEELEAIKAENLVEIKKYSTQSVSLMYINKIL